MAIAVDLYSDTSTKPTDEMRQFMCAATVVERLLAEGVRMGAMGPRTVRAVTHLDVSSAQTELAIRAARRVLAG